MPLCLYGCMLCHASDMQYGYHQQLVSANGSLTTTSLSLVSPVIHFLVKVKFVHPFTKFPDNRDQSWLGSTEGSAFVSANRSCIHVNKCTLLIFLIHVLRTCKYAPELLTQPVTTSEPIIPPSLDKPNPTHPVVFTSTLKVIVC